VDLARWVTTLRKENEELLERVAYLEGMLTPPPEPMPTKWGLTSAEAKIVARLMNRDFSSREQLHLAMSDREASSNTVEVIICRIRAKLKPYDIKIDTHRGVGYSIDRETRKRLHDETS
jgi:DNA-binding response OmpR family regulator